MRQRAAKYNYWETLLMLWTENASISATPPTLLITLTFSLLSLPDLECFVQHP